MVAEMDGIVGSMMADLMDIAEELENWEDGVGFILRGEGRRTNPTYSAPEEISQRWSEYQVKPKTSQDTSL